MKSQNKILITTIITFLLLITGMYVAYQYFSQQDSGLLVNPGEGGNPIIFNNNQPERETSSEQNIVTEAGIPPKLRQISQTPNSGEIVFKRNDEVIIRFVERATGHIFETSAKSLAQERISNTTIPRIEEALFADDGNSVILRYLDENEIIKSFYGKFSEEKTGIEGWFLNNSILAIAKDNTDKIFYLEKNGSGVEGVTSKDDGTTPKNVFASAIPDWNIWKSGNNITLTTKASNNVEGFLFTLHTSSGVLSKLLEGEGLSALPSGDFSHILFSVNSGESMGLFMYDVSKKKSVRLPFVSLAEKCVWAKSGLTIYCGTPFHADNGIYPDSWYRGETFFSDTIRSFNVTTNTEKLVYDGKAEGKNFDIVNLQVDGDESMLLFTNKRDLMLWGLTL